jgi:hypothetical protein
LNYRPHAYQATEEEQEVRQEICISLTDSVICRNWTLGMPDNVGLNRQLHRQQKALVARARGSCSGNQCSVGFSTVVRVDGYWGKTFDYFRPK